MPFRVNELKPETPGAHSFQCALLSSRIRKFHGFKDLSSSGLISCLIPVSTAPLLLRYPSVYFDSNAHTFLSGSEMCNFQQSNSKDFTLGFFRSQPLANHFSNR